MRRGGAVSIAGGRMVTAGLVRRVFDAHDFGDCIEKDENLFRKYLTVENMLERREYQSDDKEVSADIRELFQGLVGDLNSRFCIFLPKSMDEME